MNDLMTRSFLDYVDIKKQAMKDLESDPDIEMGHLDHPDEHNLSNFFEEVKAIKNEMEEITNLLLELQHLNENSKSTHSMKVLKGIRDRINSNMVTILRKAKNIKSRLESLDKSNMANRALSIAYKEGSPLDRTRVCVTNGLRGKLRDMMNDFQALREKVFKDHKEGLRRSYFNATGDYPTEEVLKNMIQGCGKGKMSFEGKGDLLMENEERHEALKEIQRSMTELHKVFLDMAVMVEAQGDEIQDIQQNLASATTYINGGTNGLYYAKQMKSKSMNCCWIGIILLIILLTILVSTLAS
ncbi:syntaxin-112-like [Euphorbia lathyris]|uniref:syntaxin-112-like n=1 Tax=Euphorbia lathyris TaxID=212925 RepID=UPI003313888C